jgi:hypothetical protein
MDKLDTLLLAFFKQAVGIGVSLFCSLFRSLMGLVAMDTLAVKLVFMCFHDNGIPFGMATSRAHTHTHLVQIYSFFTVV